MKQEIKKMKSELIERIQKKDMVDKTDEQKGQTKTN